MKKILIVLIFTISLTSCGKKGPLYLPDGQKTQAEIDEQSNQKNQNAQPNQD